jgi:regulator of sigma E protease
MMEFLSAAGYILLAIVLLLIMITIHEFGHYIAGKLLKFKIYEFSIGFGKALFKKTKKNGEVFAFRLIPLGGYCSFGEDDTDKPDTDPDSFHNKAPWKRLIVLFMGAFFNFLSAIIFAVILLSLVGYARVIDTKATFTDKTKDDGSLISLAEILNQPNNASGFTFDEGEFEDRDVKDEDGNPVLKDGKPVKERVYTRQPTQRIKAINGREMNVLPTTGAGSILSKFVEGEDIELKIIDGDGSETIVVLTAATERQWNAICSVYPTPPPGDGVYHNFFGALAKAVPFAFEVAGLILTLLWQLVSGQLGMEGVGGTVATVSVMGDMLGTALAGGFVNAIVQICFLITLISINLAVFNLLPIPSLDGARMVFVIIEWIRGKPVNRDLEAKIHAIGIICLFAFVIFADVYWVLTHLAFSAAALPPPVF